MRERWQRVQRVVWPAATGVAVVWAVVAAAPGSWGRLIDAVFGALAGRWPVVLPVALAVGSVVAWWISRRNRRQEASDRAEPGPRWLWLLTDRGIGVVVLVVAGIGAAALAVLWALASGAPANEVAKLRIESVKYGLGAIAAAGAAAALLLAMRRQRHAERAQEHVERDAAERQVTDLYTKAVEQLGHGEAAVRLGGLYALERVGQNNPGQRQTIVDVICAYLRMPYIPPTESADDDGEAANIEETTLAAPAGNASLPAPANRDSEQERQVRLTAQRILTSHLRPPGGFTDEQVNAMRDDSGAVFWPGINLDLTGAVLFDWSMYRCWVGSVSFKRAEFSGDALFVGAKFIEDAEFERAKFSVKALFSGAEFSGNAWFIGAKFIGSAMFERAKFSRGALFERAKFSVKAFFSGAKFSGSAMFERAKFSRGALFSGAKFSRIARFDNAEFAGLVELGAYALNRPDRRDVWPQGWRLVPDPDDAEWLRVVKTPEKLTGDDDEERAPS